MYDIGIYCINAARTLFDGMPERHRVCNQGYDERFTEVDEITSVTMRFQEGRLASFVTSFSASLQAVYEIVGTKGSIRLENAYEH